MSKLGRVGLIAVVVVVAVAAFLIARPGDDGDGGKSAEPAAQSSETQPTATTEAAPPPPPVRIVLSGHEAVGGAVKIQRKKGERVRIVVTSDEPDDIHVHGYDLERSMAPGAPARFSFPATIEGVFEIESHEAEHHGKDALIAQLVVEPS